MQRALRGLIGRMGVPWLLAAVAACVFGLGLNAHPVGRDEAVSLLLVRHPLNEVVALLARHEVHPAGYFLLLWAWPHDTLVGARMLSWLPAVVTAPLVGLLAARAGLPVLTAGLLAAFSPFLAYYSAEARMYSWLSLFGAAVLLLLLHLPESPGRRWGIVLGILLAAGMYIHYYAAFTALGVLVVLATRRRLGVAGWALATAAVLYLPGLLLLAAQLPTFLRYPNEPWQQRLDLPGLYAVSGLLFGGSEYHEPGRRAAIVLALPALLGIARLSRELQLVAGAAIGLPLLLGTVTTSLSARYLAAGVPLLILALAAATAVLPARPRRASLVAMLVVSLGLVTYVDVRYDSLKPRTPDFIAAAHQYNALLVIGHRHFAPQAAYYAPGGEAFAFSPPRVDHVGLWSIPRTLPYPPATRTPILLVDYCWDTDRVLVRYRVAAAVRQEADLCVFLATPVG